jgi:hypothetical protein
MAPLERIAANVRAVLAAHVPLQFVDRRRLRPTHDIQLLSDAFTTETADLKVEILGVQAEPVL